MVTQHLQGSGNRYCTHWCAATYTSSSHTEEEHRFRAIFPLSMELADPAQHRGAYWLIVNRLLADLVTRATERQLWSESLSVSGMATPKLSSIQWRSKPVPQFLLEDIDYDEENFVTFWRWGHWDRCKRCQWLLQEFLRPSEDGEYEDYYVPVMAACAGVGEYCLTTGLTGYLKVIMVRKMKTFCHLSGVVSVTIPDTLHCTHLLKSKTLTGHLSCHQN